MTGLSHSDTPISAEFGQDEGHQESAPETSRQKRGSMGRWSAILGLLLLAGGGFLAWRFIFARGGMPPGMMGGPPGLPVELQTTRTSQVQASSEFVGSLESNESVVLRPEIAGRVSNIYVRPGARVAAGTPLIQLRPEKRQAELAGVQASLNSARAARVNALSELEALRAERVASAAEVDLQNDEYRRIAVLVKEGALPQQQLDQVVRDRRTAVAQLNAIDRRIQAAQATLAETQANFRQAQANLALSREELQDTTVVAPFSGVVGDIPVKLGQLVSSSDNLTTVTQNNTLDLRLQIPLQRSPDLRLGQQVELIGSDQQVFKTGRISFISPQVDQRGQSVLAKATFANGDNQLRSGQFVRARVIWQQTPGILIPTSAISRLAGETFVYVAAAPDEVCQERMQQGPPMPGPPGGGAPPELVARQRRVKLGSLQGNSYQVLEGLKPNERVVVSGILNLSDCAPILPQQ